MKPVAEYEDAEGNLVTITADSPPPSDEEAWEPTFTVRVGDRVTQQSVSVHEIIGYLAHVTHNASHLVRRKGEVVYEIDGYCPPAPDRTALESEDGGAALIFHTNAYESEKKFKRGKLRKEPEHGMFVRIQSYDERVWEENGALPEAHDEIRRIFGKRVRVTVEVLDD